MHRCSRPSFLATVKRQRVSYHELLHKKVDDFIHYAHPSNPGSWRGPPETKATHNRLYLMEATISCELWLYLELWVLSSTSMFSKMGWLFLACFNISWRLFFFGSSLGIFSLPLVSGSMTCTVRKYNIFKVPGYRNLSILFQIQVAIYGAYGGPRYCGCSGVTCELMMKQNLNFDSSITT
jgi:hypothetical protein